ncbi:MAG: HNH endonuclease [Candidatus Cloacimonetes bacterium]|nr:HNH endonuclease [Candidatus Cloacimonadota bacterium]
MMEFPSIISKQLSEQFGLLINCNIKKDNILIITPADLPKIKSFSIKIELGWRSLNFKFQLGNYAKSFIKAMHESIKSEKESFLIFTEKIIANSTMAHSTIKFDDLEYDLRNMDSWPTNWETIIISLKVVGILVEQNGIFNFNEIFPYIQSFFGMVFSLLPVENTKQDIGEGEVEGDIQYSYNRKYERSRVNRAACLQVHGTKCGICGFDFGKVYKSIGEGFIEVHHIVPLSEMCDSYSINPRTDLIPVCPNCHSMLHRRKPAFTPEEIKKLIKN